MKKFSFACAFLLATAFAAAACGGDDDNTIPPTPDGSITLPPDANNGNGDGGMMASRCDTVNQSGCPDPNLPKCTVAIDGMGNWSNVCRALTGMVAEGADCMRESTTNDGVGRDNCDKGLYCTSLGRSDGAALPKACREFCRATAACNQGFTCMALTDNLSPPDGICITTCTLFGTDCAQGAWCNPATDIESNSTGFCIEAGTKQVGENCGGMNTCAANSICIVTQDMPNDGTCRAMCDAAGMHPCPMNFQCSGVNGLPADIGVCLPMM
jgi:hypothetical protein